MLERSLNFHFRSSHIALFLTLASYLNWNTLYRDHLSEKAWMEPEALFLQTDGSHQGWTCLTILTNMNLGTSSVRTVGVVRYIYFLLHTWKTTSGIFSKKWRKSYLLVLGLSTNTQVVNAIHGAFKNGYFSGIYTSENPSIQSIIMILIINLMAWMNH